LSEALEKADDIDMDKLAASLAMRAESHFGM
jgi:hypothetical protein